MTDPADELVVRAQWEHDRRAALLAQQCARADAEAEAADRAAAKEAADAADTAAFVAFRRQVSGEPLVSVSAILERSRLAEDGPARDPAAPWGSELNPALVIEGALIEPVPPRAQPSRVDKELDRARQLSSDLVRFRRARSNRRREAIRSPGPADEIDCHGCREVGATREQSWLLHQDPDRHPGLLAEMDPPREEDTYRADSVPTWPEQRAVPMIFR